MTKYAFYDSKFGIIKIGYKDNTLLLLKKVDKIDCDNSCNDYSNNVFSQLQEYLDGNRFAFDLQFEMNGTPFQKRVWEALCTIPYGECRTYKQIAEQIGNPKACRAVGLANNRNPISIIVPCHRVIGSSGKLVGYAGGLDMKQRLIKLEKK